MSNEESMSTPCKPVWIDPPEGWRFGFPKRAESKPDDTRQWCVDNGYPLEEALKYGTFPVRIIYCDSE